MKLEDLSKFPENQDHRRLILLSFTNFMISMKYYLFGEELKILLTQSILYLLSGPPGIWRALHDY